MNQDVTKIIIQILVLILLTCINAFCAGAEMALVSVNKNRMSKLEEQGMKKAGLILNLLKEPTKFLSTIQVAITLSGFFASASAATGISKYVASGLEFLHIPYTDKISFVLVTIVLSFFTLVYGELVPKRIALQKSEKFSLATVSVIVFVSKVVSPFVRLLTFVTNTTLKLIGMKPENLEEQISREEIQALVAQGKEQGVFDYIEEDMINSIFAFDDRLAREIMTPRIKVFAIDIAKPRDEYFEKLFDMKYSRIPVYENDMDNIIGVLHVKDLLKEARRVGFDTLDIRTILRKPYLVPEMKNIDELFRDMQKDKVQFSILINEYGEFSGIVTVEDLVEEIMGEIEDEYDQAEFRMDKIDGKTYLINGMMPVYEINDELDLAIAPDDADTISGYIIEKHGKLPEKGSRIIIDEEAYTLEVISVKKKRIEKVKLTLKS